MGLLDKVTKYLLGQEDAGLEPDLLAFDAKGVLNSASYMEAREKIVRHIICAWVATRPEEVSKREQLYNEICALGKVQAELNMLVLNGEKDNVDGQS
jgi:hypothetical protein